MAVDAFIKIAGITGESPDKAHGGDIEVFSFSWGCRQTGAHASGTGGGAGKVQVQDFSFVKKTDKASPILFMKCCDGTHIKDALFVVRKAGGKQLEYLKYKFTDLNITSVTTGGSGEDEISMETVTFGFTKCEIDYQEQGQDGGPKGGPVHGGWNVKENVTA